MASSAATSIIPSIREIDGVTYVNTGDFVESCSLRRRAGGRPARSDVLVDAATLSSSRRGPPPTRRREQLEAEAEAA